MNAVLLEFPDEAELLLDHYSRRGMTMNSESLLCVALTPAVRAFMKKRRAPCVDTIAYFDANAQRDVQLRREEMTRYLAGRLTIPDGYLVNRTYKDSIVAYLRLFIGHLMKIVEILHRVQQSAGVTQWTACRRNIERETGILPIITLQERHAASLTQAFAAGCGTAFVEISPHSDSTAFAEPRPPRELRCFPALDAWIGRLYFHFLKRLADRPSAIVNHLGYEMDVLVDELSVECPDVVWFWIDQERRDGTWGELKKCFIRMFRILVQHARGPFAIPIHLLARTCQVAAKQTATMEEILFQQIQDCVEADQYLFTHRGVSLAPFILNKARLDIVPFQSLIFRNARAIDSLLDALRPRAVLSHSGEDERAALGELCAQRNVPAVLISHGSHVPSEVEAARIEHAHISSRLMYSTYPFVAIQSRWAGRYADTIGIAAGRRLITGPLIWTRLASRRPSRQDSPKNTAWLRNHIPAYREGKSKVVLFVCAASQRQSSHFFFPETQDENIAGICDVLQAIERINSAVLVVRHRLQHLCSVDDLATILPASDRMAIHYGGRFSDALSKANLVVSFSSTAIEESVWNRIPVLLYGGGGRYRHVSATVIDSNLPPDPSAVYWVKDSVFLEAALRHILLGHAEPLDDSLVREHCFQEHELTAFREVFGSFIRSKQGIEMVRARSA